MTTENTDAQARRKIESLEGKVMAMQVAIRALIACHPYPSKAIATVTAHLDEISGMALAETQPDDFVNALVQTQENLLPSHTQLEKAKLA